MLRHADQVWVSGDNVAASVAITRRGDPPLMLGTGPQSPAWAEGKKAAVDGGPAPAMTRERRAAKSKGHRPSSAKGSDRIAVARSGHPLLSGPSDPAATDGLADHHRRIQVIPNGLDERLWGEPPQPRLNRFDPVRMLYMGTATHDADLAMILPALGRIKQTFGDRVSIELMGVTLASDLPGWISRVPMPAMAAASYPGFVNWITDQPGWEIGLAPLTDTPFNRCKSSIKTLDYAALGVAVLASDMPAYRGSLADGPGGMLIRPDEAAWHDAIAGLLRNAPMRHALAVEARQRFLEIGTLAAQQAARRRAWVDLVSCQEHQS
jgi:glycosyltransferase involved in cell wall biosynthesis